MSSQRIVLNTSASYLRSVIAAGLGLFSARWILGALGQSDFGLFSVVGSIIEFITVLNGVMAGSAVRHFAFAIGQDDPVEVNKWFNTSLSIHMILPVVLILIGWPIGEYCIRHVFTIPHDRIDTGLWVFRLSLIVAFVSMATTPYSAMFQAKQHIFEFAFWGTLQSILSFICAYLLTQSSGDRLLFYAGYLVTLTVAFQLVIVFRARRTLGECRWNFNHWFNRQRVREIFSFASWSLFGWVGGMFRGQGPAILLNIFFGTKLNAAYGIASTVSIQTVTLSNSMTGALSPEITTIEGRGDREGMLTLALRACKLGSLLMMFFAVPLVVEMDYVLKLWLHDPPEYTELFCQLMLIMFLVDYMSIGHMMAVNASGKIAAYQVTLGAINIFSVPLAWFTLKLGFAPTSIGVVLLITYALNSIGRVLWARHLLQMSVWRWVIDVVSPCTVVAASAALAAVAPRLFLEQSFLRVVASTTSSIVVIGGLGWFFVLKSEERLFLTQFASKIIGRFAS